MPGMKAFAKEIQDADFVLQKVIGKGIAHYAQRASDLWGNHGLVVLMAGPLVIDRDGRDDQDLVDCQFLGADNFFSHKVFKFAAKAFREENEGEALKQGEQAIARICERRGWKVPTKP